MNIGGGSLKGNDGKAARKKLTNRISLVLGIFLVALIFISYTKEGNTPPVSAPTLSSRQEHSRNHLPKGRKGDHDGHGGHRGNGDHGPHGPHELMREHRGIDGMHKQHDLMKGKKNLLRNNRPDHNEGDHHKMKLMNKDERVEKRRNTIEHLKLKGDQKHYKDHRDEKHHVVAPPPEVEDSESGDDDNENDEIKEKQKTMEMFGLDENGLIDHHDGNIKKLLNKDYLTEEEKITLIQSGAVHLKNISGSRIGNENIRGTFCRLNWHIHKIDPASVPMFRDVVAKSPHCDKGSFTVSLSEALEAAQSYDEQNNYENSISPPTGFVFHESRCGSTLVANVLASVSPSENRVYSESSPAYTAITFCGEHFKKCTLEENAELFQNVVYLMGRTDLPDEEKRLFFKMQSATTKSISVFSAAFPDVPWIFVHRDPVQVMMSHLDIPQMKHANCLRTKHGGSTPQILKDLVKEKTPDKKVSSLSYEEYCAAHLATLCKSAYDEVLKQGNHNGVFANYEGLVDRLKDDILPNHFLLGDLGDEEIERIDKVSGKYSKGRNTNKQWVEDSEKKENRASEEIKNAAELFLGDLYRQMSEFNQD